MSSNFPKIPNVVGKNIVIGEDFDVMKKNCMEKYSEVSNRQHNKITFIHKTLAN
jgi:hypothetical protein